MRCQRGDGSDLAILATGSEIPLAIVAGRGDAGCRRVRLEGRVVSIEEFGESGSGPEVLRLRNIRLGAVIAAAHVTLAASAGVASTPHGTPELVTN